MVNLKQHNFLRQMILKNKLLIAMDRSQMAYELYGRNKMYYQAQRIYKANIEVYNLLQEFLYIAEPKDSKAIINYIFHIEDWVEQFNSSVHILEPRPEDLFVFERLLNSIEYPKDIYKIIKS